MLGSTATRAQRLSFATGLLLGLTALIALTLFGVLRAPAPASAQGEASQPPGRGFLPDNRAWEMVSPPDKNGGQVMPNTSYTRVRSDCASECAVSFASLFGFSDTQGFSGAHTQYVSRRTAEPGTNGWTTHAITPPQETPSVIGTSTGGNPRYEGTFSPDIDSGVFFAWSPVDTADGPHPNVEQWQNLYLRTDLTSPGAGNYELLTRSPLPVPFQLSNYPTFKAGNAGDAEHEAYRTLAFETRRQIGDAPAGAQRRLYFYANGETHVLNKVPASADAACGAAGPACATVTSSGYAGGSSVGANDNVQNAEEHRFISADGSKIYFKAVPGANENIYLRDNLDTPSLDDDTVVRVQQSEKTTPETRRRAFFRIGSADGNKALFTTVEGLVDGDDNSSVDVYQYEHSPDPTNDANLTRISLDLEGPDDPDVVDVVAATDTLDHIYFVAQGALVPGQEPIIGSQGGLYHWHDGETAFLGEITQSDDINLTNTMSGAERPTRIAPDGTLLFKLTESDGFIGTGGFDGTEHGGPCYKDRSNGGPCRVLFVYKPATSQLLCASCNPSGAPATADAAAEYQQNTGGNTTLLANLPRSLSEDGRFVFFTTGASLTPDDKNGPCTINTQRIPPCADVYAYDTVEEKLELLSSGTSKSPSVFLGASSDGSDVFFATQDQLSGWDRDDAYDLYNARVGGGFPEPVIEAPCTDADGCRGDSPGSPADDQPGSGDLEGEGNANGAPPPDCTNKQNRLDKAEKKLKKAQKKVKKAKGKKAAKKAKRAKKRAKSKVSKAERKLERCRGGNS